MPDLRNIEIQTVNKAMAKGTVYRIGARVPPGMKRYVTFLSFENRGASPLTVKASAVRLVLVSRTISNPTAASCVTVTNAVAYGRKLDCWVHTTGVTGPTRPPLQIPLSGPNVNAPLMTIASSMFLCAVCTVTSGQLFVSFYEE